MKKTTIFNLQKPSSEYASEFPELSRGNATLKLLSDDGGYHVLMDSKHYLSVGNKKFFAVWENHGGKFTQADIFYDSSTQNMVSKGDILSQIIVQVIPDKVVTKIIEIIDYFK